MEHNPVNVLNCTNDAEAKQRFDSFKLGNGLPSVFKGHRPPHSRSHSRNTSISSVSSLSLSRLSTASSDDGSNPSGQGLTPSSRRNSHHRRRSSVSTRRESAEMMGISLPDLPPSLPEDNVNLGEKDSIRRRALWALEGKPDISYSKVEIPELSTPPIEKYTPELPTKPSFPPGSGMISHLPNKRDSFKLLSSASSAKDQLHTLVEEEEEEEEGAPSGVNGSRTTESLPAPVQLSHGPPQPKPALNRPRPTSLNLRPLSLTPQSLSVAAVQVSPSMMTSRSGLRSLSLSSSATCGHSSNLPQTCEPGRRSFTLPSRGAASSTEDSKPRRRSTISYKTSSGVTINHAGLPTPEATPNYQDRHFSLSESLKSSSDDEFFLPKATESRPLSAGEQHFLIKSHNALLARITDLERTLSTRMSSSVSYHRRPVSVSSDISYSSDQTGTTLGEPDDEMLQLIADLKAERDEYKRDVDAWRGRVNEMDNKLAMMAKRVEAERRDAWIARSKAGLMEIEKTSMGKKLEGNEALLTKVHEEKKALQLQNQHLQDEIARVRADLIQVKQQLDRAQRDMRQMQDLAEYEDEASDVNDDLVDERSLSRALFTFGSNMQSPETIQGHASKYSLSQSWTFPSGAQTVVEAYRAEPDMDGFFNSSEDVEDETDITFPSSPSEYSYERSKGLFSEALKSYNGDQDAPFVFPGDIKADGTDAQSTEQLPAVLEEDEEEFSDVSEDMFGEAGGICITLTPAQDDDECEDEDIDFPASPSDPPVLPPLDFDYSVEDAISFGFGSCDIFETPATDSRSPTPNAELMNPMSPPYVPGLKLCQKSASNPTVVLEEISQFDRDLCSTPPSKRGSVLPSMIPQAIASPSPIRLANVFPRPRLCPLTSNRTSQHIQRSSDDSSAHKTSSSVTNEIHAIKDGYASTLDDSASTTTTRMLFTTSMDLQLTENTKKPYSLHLPSRKQSLSVAQMPVVPSIVSRIPRLLLQSLTTFIPSMRPRRIFAVHDDPVNSSTCNGTSDFRPLPTACKYVARAVQLKKLKLQLDNERLLGMEHLDSRCKKCYGRPILL